MTGTNFVYFHGQPGSPRELDLAAQRPDPANLFAPDRGVDHTALGFDTYMDHLTDEILAKFPSGPLRMVGFSMGAFIAMDVSSRLSARALGRDVGLDLISPPAPLDTGHYLPHMAGGAVFNLAANAPWAFNIMTRLQGRLAVSAPHLLFVLLFSSAAGADRDLASDQAFKARLQDLLAGSLQNGARGYRREILAYVRAGADQLARVTAPVTLWQGSADNWTPPAMAEALAAHLPNLHAFRRFPGLSHYSTLTAALLEIFRP